MGRGGRVLASVWVPQIPDEFDALTAVALIGAETERIEIGTAVVPVQPRHPVALAQQALSVQAVCGGRLALGLGVSHHWIIDEMMGLPYERPAATMRAYLDVLDQALAGPGPVDVENELFRVHNPLDITDVAPTPGADRRPRPADAASGRGAHRRHDPVDGRRAGHRVPRRAAHHPRRRGGRAAGTARSWPASRSASATRTRSTPAVARTNRILSEAEVSPNYQELLDRGDAREVGDILAAGSEATVDQAPPVVRRRRRHRRAASGSSRSARPATSCSASRQRTRDFLTSLQGSL